MRCQARRFRCLSLCTSNTSSRSGRCVCARTCESRPSHSPQSKDDLMYHLTAHLRMNAIYWGLTALCIMGHQDALDREEMIEFVMSCWDEEAGQLSSPHTALHLTSRPCRRIRRTSGPRRTPALDTECDPDPHHPRCPRQSRHRSCGQVCAALSFPDCFHSLALQSSCRYNSPLVCSQGTSGARSIHASSTAPSTRSRS